MKNLDKTTWKKVKFGDVARSLNTTVRDPQAAGLERVIGLEHIESNSLHIKTWGSIADGTTFTRTFQPGQVLFGKRRAYQRKAALAEFAGLCSGDILVLEANEKQLLPQLLPFLVHSDGFFDHAVRTSAGSLSPRTKFQDLADYEFLLPPRDQQARLAELLWAADAVGEEQLKGLNALRAVKKESLRELFDPIKAESFTIDEIAVCLDGKRKPVKKSDRSAGVYPYYGASGIVDYVEGFLYNESILLVSEDGENLSTRNLDIAYEVDGKCWVNNHAHVLRITNASRYLVKEYFNNSDISDYVSGSTRPKLNKSTLMEMSLYLPAREEQTVYEEKIKRIDNAIEKCEVAASQNDKVKFQIINQIFSA
ncbi:MAG: restriction endonuclease subunit S [Janthinobacterium lividum]